MNGLSPLDCPFGGKQRLTLSCETKVEKVKKNNKHDIRRIYDIAMKLQTNRYCSSKR